MLVEVQHGNLYQAVRTLKLKLAKDGLLAELRRRVSYLSPSERRKAKDAAAYQRRQKHSRFKN